MKSSAMNSLKLERLKWSINYSYDNIEFYRNRFDAAKISPSDIKSLHDVKNIPFTTKDDLRDNYPFGMFAKSTEKIVRLHASSGTSGKPTVVGYTKNDIENWAECVARIVFAVGANESSIVQVAFGYGMFTGALGLHYGLEKIGATVIPCSSGNTQKQLMFMRDFKTNTLVSTPSYAMMLCEAAHESGYPMAEYNLKLGLFGSERCSSLLREQIESGFGLFATDNYGLSELCGPGFSGECEHRCGLHINEDMFLVEIIDPKTLLPVEEGEEGELVVTTLTKEALPMLRFRTKDITRLIHEPCKCGRTTVRMEKVKGRSDDMLKIRGVNVFPSQVESVIHKLPQLGSHYQLIVRREAYYDTLEVKVELIDGNLLEHYSSLENTQSTVKKQLKSLLGLEATVSLVAPKTLERYEGKSKHVLDLRNSQ